MTSGISRRQFIHGTQSLLMVSALPATVDAAVSYGQANKDKFDSATWMAIDRYVAHYMAEMNAPGLVLAVSNRDGLLRSSRHGIGDRAANRPIAPDELFQIGSISKSFAAIALLQLSEEGKLDLHKPVLDYLPALRLDTPFGPITAHHLLTHTAGLPNTVSLFPLDAVTRHRTMYAPGERFYYSNLGYDILGTLLTVLDGRSLEASLRARIFEPLGMGHTNATLDGDTRARTVMSYAPYLYERPYPRSGRLTEAPEIIFTAASGSISSTAGDMSRYVTMLANRGATPKGRLISPESFDLMVRPWVKAEDLGPDTGYGYGLMIQQSDGRIIARHTGGMVSFASAIVIDLESGYGAFASINAQQEYRPTPVAMWSVQVLRTAANADPAPELPKVDPATLVKGALDYAGVYTGSEGRKLEFVVDGERLYLQHARQRVPLETLSVPGLLARHPDFERFPLTFTRAAGDTGPFTDVAYGGDCYSRGETQRPADKAVPAAWHGFVGHYRNDSPWFGSVRIVVRRDRLWALYAIGYEFPLDPLGERTFRLADTPNTADWIQFMDDLNGQASHVSVSGEPFWRVAAP